MLQLKKITKIYETNNLSQLALNEVSINFRKNEFVAILGPSGSGKTTLLNIIGGLDKYTKGDLIINGISTKKYVDHDWDIYRNHRIGFVFQSYNLIPHQSVIANVELALTLSGVSKNERRKKAKEILTKVGLEKHINKKPNQLSGGQMQRVAIARALINNPDILLADEPTGALDSKTSEQIMNLLQEVAKDRLVIMVTHNAELASQYATRIIELKDGSIINDNNAYLETTKESNKEKNKKTNMAFQTALSLSLNNLMTKKGRTLLTAFAGSIGIIGIALILSLSSGVQNYINRVQEETLTSYPLMIESSSIDLMSFLEEQRDNLVNVDQNQETDKIYSNDIIVDTLSIMSSQINNNNLEAFKTYLESNIDDIKEYTTDISYQYNLELQLYNADTNNGIIQVNPTTVLENIGYSSDTSSIIMNDVFTEMLENAEMNEQMYRVIAGRMPKKYNEVVITVNENNQISDYALYALGLKNQDELQEMFDKLSKGEEIMTEQVSYTFDEILNLSFKLLLNTDYYRKINGIWVDKRSDEEYMKQIIDKAETIKVVGIIKPNENSAVTNSSVGGVLYTKDLTNYVINKINQAEIVIEQKNNPNVNIITGLPFNNEKFDINNLSDEQKQFLASLSPEQLADVIESYREQANLTYENILTKLGVVDFDKPSAIYIYAKDFKSKDAIKQFITDYNTIQEKEGAAENIINYSDLVSLLMDSVTNIIDIISYVLISFVSISLIVSSIMIGIITYISVLERTKEIGILRAIGASKKDISRVFNAETLIIGLFAGLFGIFITILLNIPINLIISNLANINNLSSLPIIGAIILIFISVILTMIGGLIPAKVASNKDPVEALRTE